jgi:hypothetical protein
VVTQGIGMGTKIVAAIGSCRKGGTIDQAAAEILRFAAAAPASLPERREPIGICRRQAVAPLRPSGGAGEGV